MEQTPNITGLLQSWSKGNGEALDELMPLVYDELRTQAARYLRHERPEHTLQATALIHEAYLKLISQREVNVGKSNSFFRYFG